jgi:hypothetical protein
MTISGALHLAAVIVFILVGILLIFSSALSLATGLGLDSFALAAWAVAGLPWRVVT